MGKRVAARKVVWGHQNSQSHQSFQGEPSSSLALSRCSMASRGRAAFWARKRSAAAAAASVASGPAEDEGGAGEGGIGGRPSASSVPRPPLSASATAAAKPPGPQQRSLASFGFKVPSSDAKAAPACSSPLPPASKKARVEEKETPVTTGGGSGAGPSSAPPPPPPPSSSKVLRDPETGLPLSRDEGLHQRWQRKVAADELERKRGTEKVLQVQQQQQQQQASSAKPTPLETQVAALQRQNPGTLLLFEVGYKFLLFGADAEVAAPILRLFAYCERGQLRASFPTPSLPKSVRRIVAAGHAVGVVRQTQTAALKKASGDASERSGPFERKLTAVYTAATVDAGGVDDVGGGEFASSSSSLSAAHGCGASAFLLVVADEPAGVATTAEEATAGDEHPKESTESDESDLVSLGLAAFDAASGDARWACLDDGAARHRAGQPRCAEAVGEPGAGAGTGSWQPAAAGVCPLVLLGASCHSTGFPNAQHTPLSSALCLLALLFVRSHHCACPCFPLFLPCSGQVRDGKVTNITCGDVSKMMAEGWVVLDVRPPSEVQNVSATTCRDNLISIASSPAGRQAAERGVRWKMGDRR